MSAKKWKIILCPSGSWGDVHPFIWIGKLLIAQGHEVVALAAEPFESAMQHAGIKTVRTISSEEFEEFTKDPHIWHPREAFKVVIKGFLLSCRPMIDLLKKETVPGNTLLIAGGIAFGARILSEAQNIPLITIQLQPTAFINARKPALMAAGVEWLEYLPYPIRRLFFEMIHWKVDSLARRGINALRHEEGLKGNVSHIMGDYWMSPQGVIATFPQWFAQKAEDWPPQTHVTRFPLYDEGDRLECPPELDAFLRAGDAPILFTPGSANCDAKRFFEEAAKACAILKRRGLFVTRYPSQVPYDLPETIQTFAFVPFSHVFPRCAAVIHHGGIGTTAQGLSAGVPQLVMALSHDQPDNGLRLKRLGVGDYIYPRRFRAEIIAPILDRLLNSPAVANACSFYKQKMQTQMRATEVAALIEELGRKAGLT